MLHTSTPGLRSISTAAGIIGPEQPPRSARASKPTASSKHFVGKDTPRSFVRRKENTGKAGRRCMGPHRVPSNPLPSTVYSHTPFGLSVKSSRQYFLPKKASCAPQYAVELRHPCAHHAQMGTGPPPSLVSSPRAYQSSCTVAPCLLRLREGCVQASQCYRQINICKSKSSFEPTLRSSSRTCTRHFSSFNSWDLAITTKSLDSSVQG